MVSSERPDLQEFLSALNGFLDKQEAAPKNLSHLRFLEIFCRSVGAGVGHLLQIGEEQALTSTVSFGIKNGFDEDFNVAHSKNREPSPLDAALNQKTVIAIVELKNDPSIPAWFMTLMNKHGFRSLVAVPLLGQENPAGILCAYYHDICLFDQGTLDRLMVMGRMVGGALEKSQSKAGPETDNRVGNLDQFLQELTSKPFNKFQLFTLLCNAVRQALDPIGVICGPVKRTHEGFMLTIAAGSSIPTSLISHKFLLPKLLEKKLVSGQWTKNPSSVSHAEWGDMAKLVEGNAFKVLCHPLIWQEKVIGVLIGWRTHGSSFSKSDDMWASRLTNTAALALNVV